MWHSFAAYNIIKKHIITVSKIVHLNTDEANGRGIQLYQFE